MIFMESHSPLYFGAMKGMGQPVNLYDTLPAVVLIIGVFQILIVGLAAIIHPYLLCSL